MQLAMEVHLQSIFFRSSGQTLLMTKTEIWRLGDGTKADWNSSRGWESMLPVSVV